MIRRLFNAGRPALVCLALVMLVASGPLRLTAHMDGGMAATVGAVPEPSAHAPVRDLADVLFHLLHGHGSDRADHDHSTPHLIAPAGADHRDVPRSGERGTAAARAGHGPLTPTPPPRV